MSGPIYEPGRMYHEKEFIAYVRGIIDSEKQRMEYESNRLSNNLSQLIGSSKSKLPEFKNPPLPAPPKMELYGPLKLIDEALTKFGM